MSGGIQPGKRPLIEWVLQRHPDTSRTRAKQWILAGRVSVKGEIIRKPQQVLPDPANTLELQDRRSTTLDCRSGWPIHPRVTLVYLDSSLAVVNKGPGLISVPAPNAELSALSILQDFLAGRLRAVDRGNAGKAMPAAYRRLHLFPVHRLDQYTTGVFCMACNPEARRKLIEQLKTRTMKRVYIAFVEGRAGSSEGTWRQWVDLSADQMRQRIVSDALAKAAGSQAQEAVTHYEVIEQYRLSSSDGFITKLRLRLETGRKHQIRIQAASAGLPLIGDRTYNPAYRLGTAQPNHVEFSRQALHAESLSLEHPEQPGRQMTWTVPLPKDLRQLENTLRAARFRNGPSQH